METWQYLQPIVDRIFPIAFDRGLGALTPPERNVFLVWSYPAAINDGGHASFYYNSQGEFAHETVQALHDIGASDFAQVLSKANDLFPGQQVSRGFDERYETFMALPDSAHKIMDQLDEEFYTLDDGDELISRLLKYWNGCQT